MSANHPSDRPPVRIVDRHPLPSPIPAVAGGNEKPDSVQVPAWRREPYRVFFPLGGVLAWGGVFHWFLHGLRIQEEYRSVFHSITQIQGFMFCFAVGFLFTAIPRRTGTPPPAAWEIGTGVLAILGTVISAWFERFAVSQCFWILLVVVMIRFGILRIIGSAGRRKPPNSFLWLPVSLGIGLAGSILIGIYGFLGIDFFLWHELGRLLLLQGMFLGLVAGVGGLAIPLITRGEAPPDAAFSGRDRWERLGHLVGAVLLVFSCWLEVYVSLRGGLLARCLVLVAILVLSSGIFKLPTVPGGHRWLVWGSAWLMPAGYLIAALFPDHKMAGLHVVFIGGFALMGLSVACHVTLAHGGYKELVRGMAWQVPVFGGLLVAAMGLRVLVDFDRTRFFPWITASSGAFLLAVLIWMTLIFPRLRGVPEDRSP